MATYKLVWDDYCAWYLEMVKPVYKPGAEKQSIDAETYAATINFFQNILKVLHPFMPFLTEELWHDELFGGRSELDCCIVAQLPAIGEINSRLVAEIEVVQQVVAQLRNTRNTKQLSPKEALPLAVKVNSVVDYIKYQPIIKHLGNINELTLVTEAVAGAVNFIAGTDEFYIALNIEIDVEEEKERLEKERDYLFGFLKAVNAKLSNERFMANAKPEVVENELKKKADAESKLKTVEDNLRGLAG